MKKTKKQGGLSQAFGLKPLTVREALPTEVLGSPTTIRATLAQHQSDPNHKFHGPAGSHDARADVAASGNRQRLRAHRPGSHPTPPAR